MRIALVGYGRMGRAVEVEAVSSGHEIVARLHSVELAAGSEALTAALTPADVAIDFSIGSQVADTLKSATESGTALVVGTTGFGEATAEALEAVEDIGLVHGPNFSVGVHVFLRLAREAARLCDAVGGYDVHLLETHHRHKRDHPSGTAIRAADVLLEASSGKKRWREGPPEGVADPATLYVTSIRSGEVPGTHVVGLEGPYDRMELRHEARSRAGFALGAVRAAEWIEHRKGSFTFEEAMNDILGKRSGSA